MKVKTIAAGVATLVALVFTLVCWNGIVGYNQTQDYQILQGLTGSVTVRDNPGYYFKGFATVWTYPRTMEAFYSSHPEEGDPTDTSIRVTFNDAGTAQVSTYTKIQMPTTKEARIQLHRDMMGNPANVLDAVRAHLVNCIKASGPVMSASENQASRKAEFNLIVEEQLSKGLFKMRRTEIELDDLSEIVPAGTDAEGNTITKEKKAVVQATQIVNDADGVPIVIQPSPLLEYEVDILQFSITEIAYDDQTLAQFAAKKESYLNAEKSKAQRQEEVQSRLMIEEKGRRQVAEIQAQMNQEKERATIKAQQEKEVAEIAKQQAIVEASRRVEVAAQLKLEAENLRQIAEIDAATAELKKAARVSEAEAQQQVIEIAGGITEKERVLAEIAAKRDAEVATALSTVKTPGVVIVGGEEGSGGGLMENLINMALLRATGIMDTTKTKVGQ